MALIDIAIDKYSYQQHSILSAINFQVEEKDSIGLIGLNGAGKTTLLRLLLHFAALQNGRITIQGYDVAKPKSRQDIYYLPEKFNPQDFFTGQEYLDYIVQAYQVTLDKSQRQARYTELSNQVAFDSKALQKKVSQYSKGMLQKLGIMAAVLSDKPIWVLDEPMSGLDPQARMLFKQVIQNAKAQGKTILLCTHILADTLELCNRLLAIHTGKLVFDGEPQALLKQTQSNNLEQAFLELIQ